MNPRTAIAAAALRVDRGHLECQTLILKCVCCGRPLAPGVVSRARDFEYPAHQRHRIAGLLRCDKSESHSLSLAKKAVAFYSISLHPQPLVLSSQFGQLFALAPLQGPFGPASRLHLGLCDPSPQGCLADAQLHCHLADALAAALD